MFYNNIVEFSEKKIAFIFTTGKREKNDFLKPPDALVCDQTHCFNEV